MSIACDIEIPRVFIEDVTTFSTDLSHFEACFLPPQTLQKQFPQISHVQWGNYIIHTYAAYYHIYIFINISIL